MALREERGLLLIGFFVHTYHRVVVLKLTELHWSAYLSYMLLGLLELLWGVFLLKDLRERCAVAQAGGK